MRTGDDASWEVSVHPAEDGRKPETHQSDTSVITADPMPMTASLTTADWYSGSGGSDPPSLHERLKPLEDNGQVYHLTDQVRDFLQDPLKLRDEEWSLGLDCRRQ